MPIVSLRGDNTSRAGNVPGTTIGSGGREIPPPRNSSTDYNDRDTAGSVHSMLTMMQLVSLKKLCEFENKNLTIRSL